MCDSRLPVVSCPVVQARNMIEPREWRPPIKRKRRSVLREGSKDIKYQSPHGFPGKKPAWL